MKLWILAGATAVKHCNGSERLGEAGLSLHYANIINQISMIVSWYHASIICSNLNQLLLLLSE